MAFLTSGEISGHKLETAFYQPGASDFRANLQAPLGGPLILNDITTSNGIIWDHKKFFNCHFIK